MKRLADLATVAAAAALLALVGVQAWQVFARYVLNDSPSWTEPVTVLLLTSAMSFGAAACVHAGRHFAFTLLIERAGPFGRRVAARLIEGTVATIGLMLAWGGARLWLDGLDIRMAGAPLPQGAPFLPLALGGALMALFALHRLARPQAPVPATAETLE